MSRAESSRAQLPRDIVAVTGEWARIQKRFGAKLVEDVTRVLRALPPTFNSSHTAAGAELFFGYLLRDGDEVRARVAGYYGASPLATAKAEAIVQSVIVVFQKWRERPTGDRGGSMVSAYEHALGAGRILEGLAKLDARTYPAFSRPQMASPRPEGDTITLGGLPWPELDGLDSFSRERVGLSLVARAVSASFDDLYRTFRFGSSLLGAEVPPSGVDADAWWAVRDCLAGARPHIAEYSATERASPSLLMGEAHASTRDAHTWVRAGLPHTCILRSWRRKPVADASSLARLVLQCLGSTVESAVAAAGVIAADTGWNKQPILDLPRRFIAFETEEGSAAIGDVAMVASFKRRAGHHLLVALERAPAQGMLLENALAHWAATAKDGDGNGELLDKRRKGRAFAALERYAEMAEASRLLEPKCAASGLLFVYPSTRADDADDFADRRPLRLALLGGAILSRADVTFPSIRATWMNVEHVILGSAEAAAGRAGHARASTAMRFYLRTAVARDVWNAHVRFFHDACQAVLLDGRASAIAIVGLDPDAVAWCRHLASASGIALAHQAFDQPVDDCKANVPFGFEPTEENLRDLYLACRALRRAALKMPPRAWAERCMPVLALLGAIRGAVCGKGLLPSYLAAARAAHRDHAAGLVALPPVWGA